MSISSQHPNLDFADPPTSGLQYKMELTPAKEALEAQPSPSTPTRHFGHQTESEDEMTCITSQALQATTASTALRNATFVDSRREFER